MGDKQLGKCVHCEHIQSKGAGLKKDAKLKMIMCHNKNFFQLVRWLDANAAHKSENERTARQSTW